MKLIFSLLLSLLVTGCATSNYFVPEEYSVTPDKSAFLTGTIASKTKGKNSNPNTSSMLLFRKIGSEETAGVVLKKHFMGPTKWDFQERDRDGKVFKLAIDPGDYEIYGVGFYFNNGQVFRKYESKEPFSLPFTLEEGKAYYLGEFLANGLWGKNIFGISIPAGGYFEASKNKSRDLELLKTKFPELQEQEIIDLNMTLHQPPFIFSKK